MHVILENNQLKEKIKEAIFKESFMSLKVSLKSSILHSKSRNNDRNYLLSLTPAILCEELKANANPCFQLLTRGLLGHSNPDDVFQSHHNTNVLALMFSTAAKTINRLCTGFALQLTTAARDGGLREDSVKLLPCFVHPRTSQKYDAKVLANGWDDARQACLQEEQNHFHDIQAASKNLYINKNSEHEDELKAKLDHILDTSPPQIQMVWDNVNLKTKHRVERSGDAYADSNLDWVASLWIQDRINSNHMSNKQGTSCKNINELSILDLVPSEKEKDYIFQCLIPYYAHRQVLSRLFFIDFDKPKVVSQSQSQKLTTWFSLKSQCPTTPHPHRESFKEAR